ncbi:hypothetical protein B0J17DRAFT_49815 [Rhizoctonia solani]|nr:hypothetical protein B0J17DRAFT_49815 [Rhizoctonia solani]
MPTASTSKPGISRLPTAGGSRIPVVGGTRIPSLGGRSAVVGKAPAKEMRRWERSGDWCCRKSRLIPRLGRFYERLL